MPKSNEITTIIQNLMIEAFQESLPGSMHSQYNPGSVISYTIRRDYSENMRKLLYRESLVYLSQKGMGNFKFTKAMIDLVIIIGNNDYDFDSKVDFDLIMRPLLFGPFPTSGFCSFSFFDLYYLLKIFNSKYKEISMLYEKYLLLDIDNYEPEAHAKYLSILCEIDLDFSLDFRKHIRSHFNLNNS